MVLTKFTNFIGQTTIMDSQSSFLDYSNYTVKILTSMPFSTGIGACSQILIEAFGGGRRIKEVQVNISYNTGFDTSENPLSHGIRALTYIIRYTIIRRLLLIEISGISILSIGVMSLLSLMEIYNNTKVIAVGLGLFTVATNTIGIFILLTSIILYTLSTSQKR